jgi:hypothetical protein
MNQLLLRRCSAVRNSEINVETPIIVGLISFCVAVLGVLAALLGRKKEIVHRHITEQPVRRPTASLGASHSGYSGRHFVIACVYDGVTYYGVITRHYLTRFLTDVIAGKRVDVADYWWGLLWHKDHDALPPAWGTTGGSTSVCHGPCILSPKCPETLRAKYEGATNVKVDYVVSETDVNAAHELLQQLGSVTVPDA